MQTIDLKPLAHTTGVRMISIPVAGGNKWVVEAREKTGDYESGVPSTAVIISHVQPGRGEEMAALWQAWAERANVLPWPGTKKPKKK